MDRLARRVLLCALAIELGLVLADALINYGHWTELGMVRRFFNIAREDGVASWFGTTQTWMVGLTAFAIAAVSRGAGGSRPAGWLWTGVFFCYMAMDDGAEFHERIGSAMKELFGGRIAFFPSYTWQLVVGPLFAAAGSLLLVFLWRELRTRRDRCALAAAFGLFALALALDFFEGMDLDHPLNPHGWIVRSSGLEAYDVRHFSKSVEEFSEMFATTLLWAPALRRLGRVTKRVELIFVDQSRPDGRVAKGADREPAEQT